MKSEPSIPGILEMATLVASPAERPQHAAIHTRSFRSLSLSAYFSGKSWFSLLP